MDCGLRLGRYNETFTPPRQRLGIIKEKRNKMLETLILVIAFLVVAGLVWLVGLWSGFISLVNMFLAALVATAFFEPIADQIEYGSGPNGKQFTYICDFAAIWLVFVGSAVLIRILTDSFSAVRLRFDVVTEMIGRSLVALAAGLLFVCFTHFTLLVAPLPMNGGETTTSFTTPHQIWMNLTRGLSRGSLAESRETPLAQPYKEKHLLIQGESDIREFDPLRTFQAKYQERRSRFSQQEVARVIR